jgi:hypothetical protein
MHSKRALFAFSALLIAALACTVGEPAPVSEDLPGTITAQALTLQAPSDTPGPPTQTGAPSATGTPTIPVVTVSSASNCRTGPYIYYDLLWTMQPGLTAEVVGKHTSSGTWVIKYPGGQCFLYGAYATVSGNTAALPEFPQPPTPTPSKPAAPENFKASTSCSPGDILFFQDLHVELTWTDVATNEEGYRIYRNDELILTLGANTTSAEDDTSIGGFFLIVTPGGPTATPYPGHKYSIRAYNGNGNSDWRELYAKCP